MGKTSRLVFYGPSGCGKTAMIEQLVFGRYDVSALEYETLEDTYVALVETDRGVKEKVRIHDIGGVNIKDGDGKLVSPERHYIAFADAFLLVFDVTSTESFKQIQLLKKELDQSKDKRELNVIVIGNKVDLEDHREVERKTVDKWISKEKLRYYEVSALRRQSLLEAFVAIVSKLTQPPTKSGFPFGKKEQK